MACQNQEEFLKLKWKCNEQINTLLHRHELIAAEKFEDLILLIDEKRKKFYEKEKNEILLSSRLKKFFKKLLDPTNFFG